MKRVACMLGVSILIFEACAAAPQQVQYYVLETAAPASPSAEIQAPLVVVGPVHLAEYLDQPSLAMQQGAHQIHFAQYHVWAEDLGRALPRALVNALNQQDSPYRFEHRADQHREAAALQLTLRIDQFNPTDQHQAVLAGQYWVYRQNQLLARRSFSIRRDLQQNGYPHAVATLRQLLSQLAVQLSEAVAQ